MQYLREAIEEHYYYEFVVDDIPVRDFIGHLEESGFVPHTHKVYLWTHQHFNIYYNDNKVSSPQDGLLDIVYLGEVHLVSCISEITYGWFKYCGTLWLLL